MIREQIKSKLIESMKNKDEKTTATLRLINAAIKDKDIDARSKGNMNGIDDAGVLSLLQTMIKQRRESIDMYQKGGRTDLVAAEQAEIDVIQSFLPKQMSDDEIKSAIQGLIAETGASSIKDMGKVMGALKAKYAGQMDMGKASGLIKAALG
ncbi:MAG: GatB/YqeY domain-containing protein [Pseudomonadota bacterium]|nr:GatB/YqeY domain-containing protein [Pseudomonadota bacterium]